MGPEARRQPGHHRVRADVGAESPATALPGKAARLPAHLWQPAGRGDTAHLHRAYARGRASPPQPLPAGAEPGLSGPARPEAGFVSGEVVMSFHPEPELRGHTLVVTVSSHDGRPVLDRHAYASLARTFHEAATNDEVRVVILRGLAGCFCLRGAFPEFPAPS